MKKLIAISLIFVMLFSFTACKEKSSNEADEKTSSNLTEAADTVTQASSSAITEDVTTEPVAEKYLSAADKDFENLINDVWRILMNVPNHSPFFGECDEDELKELVRNSIPEDYKNVYYYNSESDDALGCAMFIIWNGRMGTHGLRLEIDNETYYSGKGQNRDGETLDFVSDPKHKFDEDPGYIKFNADQFDLVLKEIFCVEPDRTKTSDDFDIETYDDVFRYYYHDGYYYYFFDEGGGGDFYPEMIDYTEQPDGSYIVKLSNQKGCFEHAQDMGTLDEGYVYTIYEVSAALKEVDGERIWAVSYIKPAEYVLSEK